ncbi:putative reverse transcriptase domain-containing protein [Tanacetum coccineum]
MMGMHNPLISMYGWRGSRNRNPKLLVQLPRQCEREYKSIRQLPEETSTDFMKRFLRLASFLGAKAGTQEEQAKHFKWGLNDFVLDRILNTEFTDVALVANAARNIEIFRDRSKIEGNNKRDRDGHRIRPSDTPSQGSNQRAYDQRDSDRYGNGGRYGNRDMYGSNIGRNDRQGNGSDRQGKACHRATGACFECVEVGHLAKDYKKSNEHGDQPMLNIQGYILCNPLTDKFMDFNPRVEFAHRIALISDDIYKSAAENFGGDYMNTAKANSLCLNSLQRYEEIAVLVQRASLVTCLHCCNVELVAISIELMPSLLSEEKAYYHQLKMILSSWRIRHLQAMSYNNTIGLPVVHTSQGVINQYNVALSSYFNVSYPFTPNMGFVNFQQFNMAESISHPIPLNLAQPNNLGYVYLQSGLGHYCPSPAQPASYMTHPQANLVSSVPIQPAQVQPQPGQIPIQQAHPYSYPQAF